MHRLVDMLYSHVHRVPQYVMKLTHITFTETPICDGINTHHVHGDTQYMIELTHITSMETPICDGTNTHHVYADPNI